MYSMVIFSKTSVEINTIENLKFGMSQKKNIFSGVFYIIKKLLKGNILKNVD